MEKIGNVNIKAFIECLTEEELRYLCDLLFLSKHLCSLHVITTKDLAEMHPFNIEELPLE